MPNLSIIPARAVRDPALTDAQLRVLCAIGTFTNKLGGNVWASIKTLAVQSNLSPRSVQRALPSLIASGYVRRIERPGRTNLYDIVLGEGVTPVTGGGDTSDVGGVTDVSPERPTERPTKKKNVLTDAEAEAVKVIYGRFPKRDTPHAYIPARNAIVALLRAGEPLDRLVNAADAYTAHVLRDETPPKYVKSIHRFYADDVWRTYDVVRVHGRTREEWARSGQDVAEFDRLAGVSHE